MTSLLERHKDNALVASIIGNVIMVVATIFCVYLTYHYGSATQDRQVRLDQLARFQASTDAITNVSGQFIAAINDKKNLAPVKVQFNAVLGSQLVQVQELSRLFSNDAEPVKEYEDAIEQLSDAVERTSSVTEMSPWAHSFGRVLDAKTNLSSRLFERLGVKSRS
ncbi:MAG TPA: hypothetical protein VHX86_16895 [Tepidisphaeraceae bacterium]|jgi:hypothetical protein|nr:hypothetical protein [Tepidisphaeraceae bacterium]